MMRLAAVVVGLVLITSPLHAQTLFTVAVSSASIHAAPTTASPVIATAPKGRSFEVTRELGSWVAVPWPAAQSGAGYLHVSWGTLARAATTGGPAPAAPLLEPAPSSENRQIDRQPGRLTAQPASRIPLPSHVLGIGGRLGSQSLSGFAAAGRLWFAGTVGAQVELGRETRTSASSLRMSVTEVGFSAIASPTDIVTNAVWMRPYVGGGLWILRSSLRSISDVSIAADTGRAYQAFGGAELTWANVPQLAVSADVRHVWAETPFSGFEAGGLGLALAAHWYVK